MEFDVLIDSGDDPVDMKSGLSTFQGVSDALRRIAETIVEGKVPKKVTHKSKVRTNLKRSFKGSYGQIFSLDIHDPSAKEIFYEIDRDVLIGIIDFFLKESLFLTNAKLSKKAEVVLNELGIDSDEIANQIRVSSLKNIHEVPNKLGYEVKVRYRKSSDEKVVIARFNEETAKYLELKHSNEELNFKACITRLNINTGNGRLLVEGEDETVAFGFFDYKSLLVGAKKRFSNNLDYNNGLGREEWQLLNIRATSMRRVDGVIVKYIITGVHGE